MLSADLTSHADDVIEISNLRLFTSFLKLLSTNESQLATHVMQRHVSYLWGCIIYYVVIITLHCRTTRCRNRQLIRILECTLEPHCQAACHTTDVLELHSVQALSICCTVDTIKLLYNACMLRSAKYYRSLKCLDGEQDHYLNLIQMNACRRSPWVMKAQESVSARVTAARVVMEFILPGRLDCLILVDARMPSACESQSRNNMKT